MSARKAFAADPTGRLDNAFFEKRYVQLRALSKTWDRLDSYAHSVVCGPFGSNLLNSNYVDTGIPMIRPFNLRGLRADAGEIVYLDEGFVAETGLKVFPKYTLMFARVGDINVGINIFERATISPNVIAAQVDQHKINPLFLNVFANTSYGLMQLESATKAVAQPTISTETVRALRIPLFSAALQEDVATSFSRAEALNNRAVELLAQAEQTLLTELGLADWSPPEPLTYIRSSGDVLKAGRFDAQYFNPAKQKVLDTLASMPGELLQNRVKSLREIVDPKKPHIPFQARNYDLPDALQPVLDDEKEVVWSDEVGSTKKLFEPGDVVISRLRAYLREIAVVRSSAEIQAIGSTEFIVLRPPGQGITAETLWVYLRSAPVQTVLKWCVDGSQHPRFSEDDLLNIPVPDAVLEASPKIDSVFRSAMQAKQEARQLLDRAKHAVEIAIENGESAALRYLEGS
jgi:exonuclease VII small subunit